MERLISKVATASLITLGLLVITERQAHAYLDPGSVGLVFQVMIGMLLASVLTLKIFWQRVKYFFVHGLIRRRGSQDNEDPS